MPSVLYLHGVGDDGSRQDWWDVLTKHRPELAPVEVVAPDYAELLTLPLTAIPRTQEPPRTASRSTDTDRRRYRAAQTARHVTLRDAGSQSTWPQRRRGFARVPGMIDAVGERIVTSVVYEEVGHYVDQETRRRAILAVVLAALPRGDDLVVVGHSLGALVALELVRHLPDDVQVSLLVTAASALARRRLPPDLVGLTAAFPYDRLGGWINVFNPADAVTRGLPIGMRFPQAIDVSVPAGFANHTLAGCLDDSGVCEALAAAVTSPRRPPPAPGTVPALSRDQAMALAELQTSYHVQRLLAQDPHTTVETLTAVLLARRVVGERAAVVVEAAHHDWDRDLAAPLREGTAERDLPAVLVHLATADPLAGTAVVVPADVRLEARRLVATDLGIPPAWVDVAREGHREALTALPAVDHHQQDGAGQPAAGITDAVVRALRPLALAGSLPTRPSAGLLELRPACVELLARAVTARRLDLPSAGTEERTVLSRLIVLLGTQRALLRAQVPAQEELLADLRERMRDVADSLSWLAAHRVGIEPTITFR